MKNNDGGLRSCRHPGQETMGDHYLIELVSSVQSLLSGPAMAASGYGITMVRRPRMIFI